MPENNFFIEYVTGEANISEHDRRLEWILEQRKRMNETNEVSGEDIKVLNTLMRVHARKARKLCRLENDDTEAGFLRYMIELLEDAVDNCIGAIKEGGDFYWDRLFNHNFRHLDISRMEYTVDMMSLTVDKAPLYDFLYKHFVEPYSFILEELNEYISRNTDIGEEQIMHQTEKRRINILASEAFAENLTEIFDTIDALCPYEDREKIGFDCKLSDEKLKIIWKALVDNGKFICKKTKWENFLAMLRNKPLPKTYIPITWVLNHLKDSEPNQAVIHDFLELLGLPHSIVTVKNCMVNTKGDAMVISKPKKNDIKDKNETTEQVRFSKHYADLKKAMGIADTRQANLPNH